MEVKMASKRIGGDSELESGWLRGRDERHRLVVVQEAGPDGFHFAPSGGAAYRIEEIGSDSFANKIQEFLNSLHVRAFTAAERAQIGRLPETEKVLHDLTSAWQLRRVALQCLADLGENPGIAYGTAADHEAGQRGLLQNPGSGQRGGDIPVADDGAGQNPGGFLDGIPVASAAVALPDGSSVDAHPIGAILVKEVQKVLERGGIGITQAALDTEGQGDQRPQRLQNLLDPCKVFQESASDIFAADYLCGAAQVEVDAGDGQALQRLRDSGKAGDIFPGNLRHQRPAGIVGENLPLNLRVDSGIGIDPDILGHVAISAAIGLQETPECKIGHVLHGRQDQGGVES